MIFPAANEKHLGHSFHLLEWSVLSTEFQILEPLYMTFVTNTTVLQYVFVYMHLFQWKHE